MLFKQLNLSESILKALNEAGYENPTPIQEKAIPTLLQGRDLLGCAQTGTGKTAAFAIPVLQNIIEKSKKDEGKAKIKALVLAPTRELAIQIEENFIMYSKYTKIKTTAIFGGVSQNPQVKILREGVQVLIATPGRLLDLINQGYIDLSGVEYFVLDEADRMFDMGMVCDVKKIVSKLPKQRQNLLFSATMPKEVMGLVNSILKDPEKIEIAPVSSTVDTVKQELYYVDKRDKKSLLVHLIKDDSIKSLLVFSRTKHGANNLVRILGKNGTEAEAIHGGKSQGARQRALSDFKEGKIKVLVATDIAARGIDVDSLSHVINYDLPDIPETYVHRIGRTGRAGHSGIAISFCDAEEKNMLRDIERLIGKHIPVMENVEFERISVPKEPYHGHRNDNGRHNNGNRNGGQNRNNNRSRSNDKNRTGDKNRNNDKTRNSDKAWNNDNKRYSAQNQEQRKLGNDKKANNRNTSFRNSDERNSDLKKQNNWYSDKNKKQSFGDEGNRRPKGSFKYKRNKMNQRTNKSEKIVDSRIGEF